MMLKVYKLGPFICVLTASNGFYYFFSILPVSLSASFAVCFAPTDSLSLAGKRPLCHRQLGQKLVNNNNNSIIIRRTEKTRQYCHGTNHLSCSTFFYSANVCPNESNFPNCSCFNSLFLFFIHCHCQFAY